VKRALTRVWLRMLRTRRLKPTIHLISYSKFIHFKKRKKEREEKRGCKDDCVKISDLFFEVKNDFA
jgi:translation initiation factor IF-3